MEILYVFVELGVIYISNKRLQALYKKLKEYKQSLANRDLNQSDLAMDQMQIQKLKQVEGYIQPCDNFIKSDISSSQLIVKKTIKYKYNPISHYLWRPLMQNGIFSNKTVLYQFSKDFILQSPLNQIYVQLDRSKESDKQNVIQLQKVKQEDKFQQIWFAPSRFYLSYEFFESGLSVGSKVSLFGNFIYNFQTKQLRCFKVKAIGENKYIQSVITHKMFKKGVYFLVFLAISTSLSLNVLKIIRGIIMPESKYPKPLNIDKVLIKKGKQDLKCSKCQQSQLNVIALPCTHFDSCIGCLKNKANCSVCNKHISEQRRVFSI